MLYTNIRKILNVVVVNFLLYSVHLWEGGFIEQVNLSILRD